MLTIISPEPWHVREGGGRRGVPDRLLDASIVARLGQEE